MATESVWRSRVHLAILLAIVATGTALRLKALNVLPFWFDEAFSWRVGRGTWSELFDQVARDNHSPLYFALLKSWCSVFGWSIPAMRAPSVVAGVASITLTYHLGVELFGRRTGRFVGLLAASMMAASPAAIYWSVTARMYSLALLLSISSTLLFAKAVRTKRIEIVLLYAAAICAMTYAHYFTVFTFVAQLGIVGYRLLMDNELDIRRTLQDSRAKSIAIASGAVVIGWLPWTKAFLHQRTQVNHAWWAPKLDLQSSLHAFASIVFPYVPDNVDLGRIASTLGAVTLASALAFLAYFGHWHERPIVALVSAPFLAGVVLSLRGANILNEQYLLFAQPPAMLALAVLVGRIRVGIGRRWIAGTLVIAWMASTMVTWPTKNTRSNDVARYLTQKQSPSDVVVIDAWDYFTLDYLAPGHPKWFVFGAKGQVDHFNGGPLVSSDDHVVSFADLEALPPTRVWIIENLGGFNTRRVPHPKSWKLLEQKSFNGILVMLLTTIPPADSGHSLP